MKTEIIGINTLLYSVKDDSDVHTKYSEVDVIKCWSVLSTIFTWSLADRFSANSWHSNGHRQRPLTCRLISLRV